MSKTALSTGDEKLDLAVLLLEPVTDREPCCVVEIGIRIGELSLPENFDGVLVWGRLYNRPFLRCLHGYALCLWRLGQRAEAQKVFERILSLNPNDNQGVRFCWADLREGRSWEAMNAREDALQAQRRHGLH